MTPQDEILQLGRQAQAASRQLALLTTGKKDEILAAMADELAAQAASILEANARDLAAGRAKGLSPAMLDRLALDADRLTAVADGIRQVAALPDPVGEELARWTPPNQLDITKVRVPIGVIGIIYESRPNVTSDAAALCFKTGNATILLGGSEAIHSNTAIAKALQEGGARQGLPDHSIQLVPNTDRESVRHLAEMDRYLDLIIPRGGKALIETVVSLARMPVIKHYDGICHVYVDAAADLEMATRITVDAKTQKPGVCNAAETLLVHRDIAADFLPKVAASLAAEGVELRADPESAALIPGPSTPAVEADWATEYLDLILSVKVVPDLAAAIAHINSWGSHHSDSIVTADQAAAERFLDEVDSAAVFVNASTRFNDGEEFGFGAEIGISTDKLHARGPMGLRELTSYKYKIRGTGQTKAKS
ncbi:glutamate-5-semialdehyde dehydrogenase [soil metagenome]